MDPIWFNFISFLTIYVLAIVSPGPNFILVVDRSLTGTRKEGLFTALGVATGSGLFGLAGLAGLIVIVNALPNFAVLIRVLGGGYLVWLGLNMMHESFRKIDNQGQASTADSKTPLSAWRMGLFTNLTNPKAWAFYFALFTVVITPGFLLWQKMLLNSAMFLISFGWYALVALLVSSAQFRPLFHKSQPYIQFVLGLLLVGLGGKIFIQF